MVRLTHSRLCRHWDFVFTNLEVLFTVCCPGLALPAFVVTVGMLCSSPLRTRLTYVFWGWLHFLSVQPVRFVVLRAYLFGVFRVSLPVFPSRGVKAVCFLCASLDCAKLYGFSLSAPTKTRRIRFSSFDVLLYGSASRFARGYCVFLCLRSRSCRRSRRLSFGNCGRRRRRWG